jgi:hypothetical protein
MKIIKINLWNQGRFHPKIKSYSRKLGSLRGFSWAISTVRW